MTNEEQKKLILSRRARFLAAALTGVGIGGVTVAAAGSLEGCSGGEETAPQPCLTTDTMSDTAPQPCLTDVGPPKDTSPEPCLSPPFDSGSSDGADANEADADGATDTGPAPCLTPAFDSGSD